VPLMPTPRSRQAARLRARRHRAQQRARWLAVLTVVGVLGLVTLLLTAFGSGAPRTTGVLSTTGAVIVPGDTRPELQVLATVGNLQLKQPVSQGSVTGIGFRGSRDGAVGLNPAGRQANEGLLLRLWHRIAGTPAGGLVWYQLSGSVGPGTTVLNVGAAPGTDVYAPVTGTIAAISDFVIDGRTLGARIDIRPQEAPAVFVSLIHLRPDPALTVGSSVREATSKIGTVVDVAAVERQALAAHARNDGNNVAIAVYPAAGTLP
jgi:hypothetical protein